MILARGDHGDDQFLLIGLSRANIDRLVKGQPILIRRKTHGEAIPELWKIALMFGETENQIAAELRKNGMLQGTKIIKHPGL
jgi:hypothetical protein